MPVPTRQATPGSSTAILGDQQPQTHPTNSKKRSASEVGEDIRDAKKAKVEGGALSSMSMNRKQAEKDKKKKKKKKKRRTSVVLAIPQPRDREVSRPSSTVAPTSIPKGKSPEHTNGNAKSERDDEAVSSSSDKGKGKARSKSPPLCIVTPVTEPEQPVASGSGFSNSLAIPTQTSEINCLKEQLATQKALLQRHQAHFSHHQQSLTCQICLDLMHKPYALTPCGHTTCYGCLVRWFTSPTDLEIAAGVNPNVQNDGIDAILNSDNARNGAYVRRRKNCPICRAVISERPIEMWGIKSMVAALVRSGLAELSIPLEPVVEENVNDLNDPWRHIFRRTPPSDRHVASMPMDLPVPGAAPPGDENRDEMGWYDTEDGGIYRCNECYHEIMYGRCTRCQRLYPGHMGYGGDDDDEDEDEDFDAHHFQGGIQRLIDALMDDAQGEDEDLDDGMFVPRQREMQDQHQMNGLPHPHTHPHLRRRINNDNNRDIFEESNSEGDEADHEAFLELANMYYRQQQQLPLLPPPHGLRRGAARIEELDEDEDEDEEEEDEEESDYEGSFIDDGAEHEIYSADEDVEVLDDGDSEDNDVDVLDRPPGQYHRTIQRFPGAYVVSSDEDEGVDGDMEEHLRNGRLLQRLGRQTRGNAYRRRVVVEDDDDEEDDDDDSHAEEAMQHPSEDMVYLGEEDEDLYQDEHEGNEPY